MVHHEYKKEDMTAFANFYGDFFDSFMMNSGVFASAFLISVVGLNPVTILK